MNEHEIGNEKLPGLEQERHGPRIYAASLSDYNDGRLYGAWVDADIGTTAMMEQISDMLAGSRSPGAEEWVIHDYDGFGPISLSEYEDIDSVSRLATGIADHGEAFAHWASITGSREPDELDQFSDAYQGCFESVEAYAEQLLDAIGVTDAVEAAVANSLVPYVKVDVAGFARDLELSGDIATATGSEGVYVFDMRR
jgi:antirestriction protein